MEANLAGASSERLVITTGTLPPTTTPAARISRYEGMEAHARTGDVRLKKYGYSS